MLARQGTGVSPTSEHRLHHNSSAQTRRRLRESMLQKTYLNTSFEANNTNTFLYRDDFWECSLLCDGRRVLKMNKYKETRGSGQVTLGKRIRKLRKEKGWTQRQLEEKAGIENRNLTRYESDKVRPRLSSLKMLAQALEVSVDELTAEEHEKAEQQFQDKELLNQFLAVEKMDGRDRDAIKCLLQAMIVKNRLKELQTA
jgi:transcriptional regulator with XRE-family HTH domain